MRAKLPSFADSQGRVSIEARPFDGMDGFGWPVMGGRRMPGWLERVNTPQARWNGRYAVRSTVPAL